MKLEQSFTVQAPADAVWAALIDVQRVAPCLPGAQITEAGEDGSYKGTFTVKLGPTTANYNGTLKLHDIDEPARRATMSARGTDKRGKGGASATIVSTLHEDSGATRVDVVTDFTITGRLASFGRSGMIQDISNRLMKDFAGRLQETIGTGGAAAPPESAPIAESALVAESPPEPPAAPAGAHPPSPAKPISGLSLVFGALLDRLRRLIRRRPSS